jgi:hypothetical protein
LEVVADLAVMIEHIRRRRVEGVAVGELIEELRSSNLNILDAIKIIRAALPVDLGTAKILVSEHPAWVEIARGSAGIQAEGIEVLSDETRPKQPKA